MKKTEITKYYIATLAAIAAFVVYLSSLQHQFIVWDDNLYVYDNLHIHSLDTAFFKWAFFDFNAGNWHPLTWMSHALDYAIWGLNPLGHHLTNNILHAVNTFLVVVLVVRLLEIGNASSSPLNPTRPPLRLRGGEGGVISKGGFTDNSVLIAAAATGLMFGLHPLHVESVAWVSERKDLLCALFFLLSIMAYMRYVGNTFLSFPLVRTQADLQRRIGNPSLDTPVKPEYDGNKSVIPRLDRGIQFLNKQYLLSLLFFILALMSKPMAVSLPLVLLILDWYPMGRVQSFKSVRSIFAEKVPFIILSIISSVVTVYAQRAGSALASMETAPLPKRLLVGTKSLIAYLWKMVLPVDLVPFYPYPTEASLASLEYLSAIVLVCGITVACIMMARRQKLWLSVWGYYVLTLLPVLGIVQVGLQSMADRYTYLPSLGPFLVIGLATAWVWTRLEGTGNQSRTAKVLAVAASVLVLVSLSYATFKQTGIWKNSIVFWSYVIEKEPERVPVAYYNRGIAFDKMGMSEKAIADYGQAIALKPSYSEAYNNRGLIFEKKGLFDKAIKDLETAMALKPSSPEAYNNLGKIYRKTGQFDKAIENYNRAIAMKPSYEEAYFNRAISYEKMGQVDMAIEDYNKAIVLKPSYYEAYFNMGVLYGNTGSIDKAIENFTKAISLNPGLGGAYVNRGVLYSRTGNKELAISDFQKACDLGNKAGCGALDALVKGQVK